MKEHATRGKYAEQSAHYFLEQQGLRFLLKNYRCYYGEIDLIMHDHNVLVFIEVRLRTRYSHGNAIESITETKQQRVIRTAQHYLMHEGKRYQNQDMRFDVVGIDAQQQIDWIKNAFEVQ